MELVNEQNVLANIPFDRNELGFHKQTILTQTAFIPYNYCETRHNLYQQLYSKLEKLDGEEEEIPEYSTKYLGLFVPCNTCIMNFQKVFCYGFNCSPDFERLLFIENWIIQHPDYLIRIKFTDEELLEFASSFVSPACIA